jgi:ketosteroid isomerase-like protein
VEDLESTLKRLAGRVEVENLPKTMAWAMDSGDKELWLRVWSDDIQYVIPQYNIEIKGKEELMEFGEAAIFTWEEKRFSSITNIMIELDGDKAKGRDYYMHYGFPINPDTGEVSDEPANAEGMHFYEFGKRDGAWKITRMEVYVNRSSAQREENIKQ